MKFYDVYFFYFWTFLQVLFKKLIWHFDVTWLISQQFTCRDIKPVAFLVPSKFKCYSKHSSANFNNVRYIFVCIQFVAIDWCNSCFTAMFFANLSLKVLHSLPIPLNIKNTRGVNFPLSISKTLSLHCCFFSFSFWMEHWGSALLRYRLAFWLNTLTSKSACWLLN